MSELVLFLIKLLGLFLTVSASIILIYRHEKLHPDKKFDFNWYAFYVVYFFLLYFYIFLWHKNIAYSAVNNTADIFRQIHTNPFIDLSNDWEQVLISSQVGHDNELMQFFFHYVLGFLSLMPFADFIYSFFCVNRRNTFALIFIISLCIEIIQLIICLVIKSNIYFIGLTDTLISSIGAAFFLFITYILRKKV